jgi:hypothetical protein
METSVSFEARSAPSPYPTTGMKQSMQNSHGKGLAIRSAPSLALLPRARARGRAEPTPTPAAVGRGGVADFFPRYIPNGGLTWCIRTAKRSLSPYP